jgi:exopolyphosphatase/guanosine-5'-triphosphate,3'-diphosphate pyrophosphatase
MLSDPVPNTVVDDAPLAVIDVGTTSIRMAVAQVQPDGSLQILDTLQQSVMLGNDAFRKGVIALDTAEECVAVLRSFTQVLREMAVPLDAEHVRVIATSAVREASNRDSFLDRIYIATGLDVEVADQSEVSRFTYLSVQPFFELSPFADDVLTLMVEVGGGSTEVLGVHDGRVLFSQGHRLGSLRMWQIGEGHGASVARVRDILENQIGRMIEQIHVGIPDHRLTEILAIGGDARFAAEHLETGLRSKGVTTVPLDLLIPFVDDVLSKSADELVRRYRLTYPEAETLGPALLTYVRLAQAFERPHLYVTTVSMRDGVLCDIAGQTAWAASFRKQIISSALSLGAKYQVDHPHAAHVAALSMMLFRRLQAEHGLGPRYMLILHIAALLHEIGLFVSNRSHHKHSMYLILNSDIFGMGTREKELTALLARYHRRSTPLPAHELYSTLDRDRRIVVAKLAAILRVADALDRSHAQRVRNIDMSIEERQFIISVPKIRDLTLEQMALDQKSDLFEQVYGMHVILRRQSEKQAL